MIIMTLRTDKPEAELGLYQDDLQVAYEVWEAHRQLAETIHKKISTILDERGKSLKDLGGIVCYKGPGSFTGLRIGLAVANALASGLDIPIVGIKGEGTWLEKGQRRIMEGQNDRVVIPEYGAPVHITQPKG